MVLRGNVESNPSSVIPALCFICPGLAWLHSLGSGAVGSISNQQQAGGMLPAPFLLSHPGKWLG